MNLSKPIDTTIPFIAYGSFKPSELRFNLIEEYVHDFYEIKIAGLMEEKDGVPIFGFSEDGYYNFTYTAFVINFKKEHAEIAYQKIAENEQDSYYEWLIIDNKNILIGKPNLEGKIEFLNESWSFRNDPYFEYGLTACSEIFNSNNDLVKNDREKEYFSFFKSSSAYKLLWTLIERFCALKYGNISLAQKLKSLTSDPAINWKVTLLHINRKDKINRSDKKSKKLILDKHKSANKNIEYYYGLKSNIVQSKIEILSDTYRISEAYFELKLIFEDILNAHGYFDRTGEKGYFQK